MCISAKAFVVRTVCVAVLAQEAVIFGQEPISSPGRASSEAPAPTAKRNAEISATQAGVAKPAQPSAPDFFHREELTGDWSGTRTQWKNKGVELAGSLTQFYQGVASGGIQTGTEYNGTAQARLTFDLGKLVGWNYWSAEIKAETRFGGPLLTGTGTINPVNTAVIIPGADGTVFALTAVNVTKLFPRRAVLGHGGPAFVVDAAVSGTRQIVFGPRQRVPSLAMVNMQNKSHAITAEIEVPKPGAEAVIAAMGGITGGWSLYTKNGKPKYCYNFFGLQRTHVEGTAIIPPGRIEQTEPFAFGEESCDVGHEGGSPVTTDYAQNGGTTFSGKVNWVEFDAGIAADDQNHLITPEERLQVAMARQ